MIKRVIKITLIVLLSLVLLVGIAAGGLLLYSKNYSIPEQAATIENNTGLVQEGWMSPFALEPLKNEDGSYVKDGDNNIQYPEFSEEEFRAGLKSNPNLAGYDLDELLDYYRSCFFTEADFKIIKEELKLNTIRLPFYYLDILNEDLTKKSEEDAFSYIDWFISMAAKYELYIVLDLHGAPGSQNGYEHSGAAKREANLWTDQKNVDATVALWDYISWHYINTRPDLGKWIATYDIMNEPTYTYGGVTTKECWDVFDRIYDTIRDNGDKHVITMEGCWDFGKLPDPADYEWENVQYEYHWYNWWSDKLPYDVLYAYHDFWNLGRDYDVPVYIGEFTLFEDTQAWEKQLQMFKDRNYSWTAWNYKTTVTGWWTSSWGVYTCQMNLNRDNEETKCNVATCTYDEFIAACEKTRTESCEKSTLYKVLTKYTGQE